MLYVAVYVISVLYLYFFIRGYCKTANSESSLLEVLFVITPIANTLCSILYLRTYLATHVIGCNIRQISKKIFRLK